MWKCPVCEKENENAVCTVCGYDCSCACERYPTLGNLPLIPAALSVLKAEWTSEQEGLMRCPDCGGTAFSIQKARGLIRCLACRRQQELIMTAQPEPAIAVTDDESDGFAVTDEEFLELDLLPEPIQPVPAEGKIGFLFREVAVLRDSGQILRINSRGAALAPDESIISVAAGPDHLVCLRKDGTVTCLGAKVMQMQQCRTESWTDIVAVVAGSQHTVGLRRDGSVVATGDMSPDPNNRCNTGHWRMITRIAAGNDHTLGLRADGTVVSTRHKVEEWTGVASIAAGPYFAAGLRHDGTVLTAGFDAATQKLVGTWTDITAISAGKDHLVGLRRDGRVVSTRVNTPFTQHDVKKWVGIVAVAAGNQFTLGLRYDGTVMATGNNLHGQCNVKNWKNIVTIAAKDNQAVGIQEDGTIVAVGQVKYNGK